MAVARELVSPSTKSSSDAANILHPDFLPTPVSPILPRKRPAQPVPEQAPFLLYEMLEEMWGETWAQIFGHITIEVFDLISYTNSKQGEWNTYPIVRFMNYLRTSEGKKAFEEKLHTMPHPEKAFRSHLYEFIVGCTTRE